MTSIPDPTPDRDVDLSGISPELVLVDPELARKLREREPVPASRADAAAPMLRLLPPPDEQDERAVEWDGVAGRTPLLESATDADEPIARRPSEELSETVPSPPVDPAPAGDIEPVQEVEAPASPAVDLADPIDPADAGPERPTSEGARWRRPGWMGFGLGVALATLASFALMSVFDNPGSVDQSVPPSSSTSPLAGAPGGGDQDRGGSAQSRASSPTITPSVSAPAAKPKPTPTPKGASKPTQGTAAKTSKPTRKTTPSAKVTTPTKPRVAEPQRFAWAPVAGALRYHVELFRGSNRVLARETERPALELGPTWRHDGELVRLTPDLYRWYVWPVTKGGRATQAIVQAKLDLR